MREELRKSKIYYEYVKYQICENYVRNIKNMNEILGMYKIYQEYVRYIKNV